MRAVSKPWRFFKCLWLFSFLLNHRHFLSALDNLAFWFYTSPYFFLLFYI